MEDPGLRIRTVVARRGERRAQKRLDTLEEENRKLQTENEALRKEFRESRSIQERVLKVLEDRPVVEVKRRRGSLLRLLVVGAGAYVLGTRAGRERYEQIVAWVRQRFGRGDREDYRIPEASASSG
jgi:regulator of replication initiation timing